MATAFPRSITLPPPTAATTSAPCSRAVTAAAWADLVVGSPLTVTTVAGMVSPASSPA
jgi:hypothetical protein